ncbi:hypothetical protein KIW84_061823 [Lathyrus oleraceus]|uniref:Gag-pol polyprotein n=1 Tax=Pisum sativum TaxID=3888 RepID=A0A9D4W6W9_PEA|nr:hypothetical protein KIW84_061823 [Pisum sativum]
MVDTDSTTITPTPITFEDVPIENQGDTTEDVVENEVDQEVESVKQLVTSNYLRRFTRDKGPSIRYPSNEYVFLTDGGEPESFDEVLKDENKKKWIDAMEDEMQSVHENNTFELVSCQMVREH